MIADATTADKALAVAQEENNLLEKVVHEHARMVYRIAYSVLRTPAEAEDAVQETFLRVLRHGKKIARVQDQKAWLARIAWRVAVERRRKRERSSARDEEPADTLVSLADGADQILLEKERGEILRQLIAALPDELRDPLVLLTLEELSPREVGGMLGMTEAAVRSRTFRARQILKEKLEARLDGKHGT